MINPESAFRNLKSQLWHFITSEYPPQRGGVSDYSYLVATGLAAEGETVHVWCPAKEQRSEVSGQRSEREESKEAMLVVHRDLGRISPADLRRVGRMLDQFPGPRRLLVQWVPHGYGYRSMNLPFCLWLRRRARIKHDQVEIMVHEPFLAFGEGSIKQDLAAAVHRVMVIVLLNAASRLWVSIPDWEKCLRPFLFGRKKTFRWLPVPSNIPVVIDPDGVAKVRAQVVTAGAHLVGHFGAYDRYMVKLMLELLPALLSGNDKLSVMLLGKGSMELRDRLVALHPDLSRSVRATGQLSAADLSRHLSACDVMLQPYEDGVSGRRGSVMAALAHGIPVVTTTGKATESCWLESGAVKLTKIGDIDGTVETARGLLADAAERYRLSAASRALYEDRFDVKQTIAALRGDEQRGTCGARSEALISTDGAIH